MKKQKVSYQIKSTFMKGKKKVTAKKEVAFELKLASVLVLDELCYMWNKHHIEAQLNDAIDQQDKERFMELSELYKPFTHE
ncbi:IDEAL domain-containing protein [Pontibacillus litoralis]|uniref:IDEAL domain-containing protein n=1 Tax=Pontibacillus litoralis JSM 072002 TaxID=1385512 RepID=A0A0A5G2C7_9BACI|nr:IDEAL domain-containing protein [Pontibacillus litoralis]KGX85303.1 hypothetical protein N784_09690 [Pontibacillus litoralis JSM 072002]